MSTDYDIAIVGGGLVGTSLALALDQQGWRVALLERAPFRDTAPPTFDDRTLALSQASQNILDGIGLWSALERDRTAIRQVHVSQPGAPGVVNLVAEDYGLEALGHVVQARGIGREVKAALPQLKQVSLLVPAQVTAIETAESAVTVSYDHDGETRQLTCRLLIGADGTRSVVRRGLGLEARVHDYEQTAVIANVMPGVDHQGRAFERLTPSGPLAVLPHVERRVGIVWVAGTQEAEAVLALDDEAFLAGLQQRFGYRLGELTRPGERASYPITQLALDHPVAQRAVVIGNAAHTLHPVAAQGFNLGLRDVATLAHLLARTRANGGDPGADLLLARYARWRVKDVSETLAFTDGLVRWFAARRGPLRWLRSAGLLALGAFPELRRGVAWRGMGFANGPIPDLAQGRHAA